ncbi:hypothetical protein SAMN05661080_00918 [Modestobacter sp. DSM 44400]|nr:hypothetical protein SAMN05661080_00918 [Modestobacter sp. DSM 44400]
MPGAGAACRTTSTAASASKTVVNTTWAPVAASTGESRVSAPVPVSARAFAASRFHIRTGMPARRSEPTIPAPIVPVPRTATTGSVMSPILQLPDRSGSAGDR